MKFDNLFDIIMENDDTNPNELSMGIEVEKEHKDLLNLFKEFCTKNKVAMPLTDVQFFTMIAKAHLKEFKTYYTHLKKMEAEMKK